jgi:SAM-dependent methyltransferase
MRETPHSFPGRESDTGRALARYYDMDVAGRVDDIDMYLALASACDGRILELACGTGRITLPVAGAGNRVTGVDVDPYVLERARRKWGEAAISDRGERSSGALHLVQADMTDVTLEQRFELAILGFNSLLLLSDRDRQRAAIRTLADHLTPNGRAVVDVWLPASEDLGLYDGRLILEWIKNDPDTGEKVSKTASARCVEGTKGASVDTIFEAWRDSETPRKIVKQDEIRFVTADEVLALVEESGMQPQQVACDYAMSDFEPNADRIIVVAAPSSRVGRARRRPSRSNRLTLL